MALTDVDVCNLALARVGHKQFIASLTEDTEAADCCAVAYGPALAELLEGFDWSFARKHAVLALTTSTRSGWAYAYALPSDCLAVRSLFNGLRAGMQLGAVTTGLELVAVPGGERLGYGVLPKIAYDTEAADDGGTKLLLTDLGAAEALYTSNAVAPGNFAQAFVQALAWRVASDVALALPVKRDLHQNATAQAARALAHAKAVDLRQRKEDAQPESSFVTVRG